jgi:hypothetical protein
MLERDVNNLRGTLGRVAPELLATEFAREMWSLFEQGERRGCQTDENVARHRGAVQATQLELTTIERRSHLACRKQPAVELS